ncbi:MAG: hypothetical protein WDO19_13770 [Bacteroidota bacterium]
MNKPIRTYEDLLEYKSGLQEQLYMQKQLIYEDVHQIKEELKPLNGYREKIGVDFLRRAKIIHGLSGERIRSLIY